MDKILNQDEIDALLRASRSPQKRRAEQVAAPERVSPFVFGQSGGITSQQTSAVNLLHETFARNLTQRLSAYLRAMFEVTLVSAEQLRYTEFLQQITERSYLASIHIQPLEATGLFELDLATAFPIIDLLLGGEGKMEPPDRDLTEIEELILQSVIELIFQELQGTWENLVGLKFDLERRQQQAQVVRLLPSNERVLAISFEVQIPGRHGTLTFGLPASVSGALLRKISEQSLTRKRHIAPDHIAARQHRVEECRFALEMKLPETPIPAQDLLGLAIGQTLVLQHRVDEPVVVTVANQKLFSAYPVRAHNARGGLIEGQLSHVNPVG
jgi:flagellar motor switch protein FliM